MIKKTLKLDFYLIKKYNKQFLIVFLTFIVFIIFNIFKENIFLYVIKFISFLFTYFILITLFSDMNNNYNKDYFRNFDIDHKKTVNFVYIFSTINFIFGIIVSSTLLFLSKKIANQTMHFENIINPVITIFISFLLIISFLVTVLIKKGTLNTLFLIIFLLLVNLFNERLPFGNYYLTIFSYLIASVFIFIACFLYNKNSQ